MRLRFTSVTSKTIAIAMLSLMMELLPASAQELPPTARQQTAPDPAIQTKKAPSPKSLGAWRGKVIAHLNSRKSAAAVADGTATVTFRIDRTGKVLSSQVVASSGNNALDAEAIALTKRASPVPAPPADITSDTLYLKVPIRFRQ